MSIDQGLIDWISEALAATGVVTSRKMMGGATLYCDGAVFAIIANDQLWFKSDATSDPEWEAQGCVKFTYQFANGRAGTMNYRAAPDAAYDDAESLHRCAALALEAGARAAVRKGKRRGTSAG